MSRVGLVVPTIGRPSLARLLDSLASGSGPLPEVVVVVDDRPIAPTPVLDPADLPGALAGRVVLARSGGRGPAAARNVGWRLCPGVEWVAFVDDDVLLGPQWPAELGADLAAAGPEVGGVTGVVEVPLPADRRPTDWERGTAGLADASWITADMAYRTAALRAVDGFDSRFPRAFREDADLALRVQDAGWTLQRGTRRCVHPVRPAAWNASLRAQRGNADDALMRALHGPGWGRRAAAPPGRRARHAAITAAGLTAILAGLAGRPRLAAAAAAGWAAGTAEFATARIAPGPRTRPEVAAMLATSVAIPPAALGWWLLGLWRSRHAAPWQDAPDPVMRAVLFDRDATLVRDVPYNGDPDRVELLPGAREVVAAGRAAGLKVGVVSNQSGVARGLLHPGQVAAVNRRVDELLGGLDTWQICPHAASDRCDCRKPAPGLVLAAAREVGVSPAECVVIGDIGADVGAAAAAGARGVLVPTPDTRREELALAPVVCPDLLTAARVLGLPVPAGTR